MMDFHTANSLARTGGRAYPVGVKRLCIIACAALSWVLSSCGGDNKTEEVTETRSEVERFDRLGVYPTKFEKDWRIIGSTSGGNFGGVLTFAVGQHSKAVLSIGLRDTYLANINRWMVQFGNPELEQLPDYEKITMFGESGFLVPITGTFRGSQENWGMLAATIIHSEYGFCVLKLTGPEQEVEQQMEAIKKMSATLKQRIYKED